MQAQASEVPTIRTWLGRRLFIVGSAALVGIVVGVVLIGGLALYGGAVGFGTRKAFGLGALVLGFGTLGWSGSAIAGRSLETMQRHLDSGGDWTERKSRQAMSRLVGLGVGMMISTGLVGAIL